MLLLKIFLLADNKVIVGRDKPIFDYVIFLNKLNAFLWNIILHVKQYWSPRTIKVGQICHYIAIN